MEPRVQYARTSDGVSIAYWTLGDGPPLVHMSLAFSHAHMVWRVPEIRRWYEALAEKRTVIHYDWRGQGLSDREVPGHARDAHVLDLEAIVDELRLEKVALFAAGHSGPSAITYAARHPERVSHLILWQSYARGADWFRSPQVQAIRALVDRDWRTYTEAAAHTILGWSEGDAARRFAELIRETATPDSLKALFEAWDTRDVTEQLPLVQAETLVMQRRFAYTPDLDVARRLASGIPRARLAIMEGESAEAYLGDWQAVVNAVYEFLGEETRPASRPGVGGTAIILFADIADSTALTERLGDGLFREKARALESALREQIRANGGTAIEGKLLGDGVLAVFASARQAIEAALCCGRAGDDADLALHLGMHAGDVISEDGNVYGGAVNIASRIAGLSAPGEVLVSQTVRDLGRTSAGASFEDRGERALKGIADPLRIFAVGRRSE